MIGLVLAVALGILVGFARGGSLKTLGDARLRAVPIVFAGVAMQIGAAVTDAADLRWLAFALVVASFASVFAFAAFNFLLPGMTLIGAGALCNFVVITANGGMPVSVEALEQVGLDNPFVEGGKAIVKGAHRALTDDSKLRFLADTIPVNLMANVISIGDILIWAGILLLIQQLMVGPRGKRRRGARKAATARSEPD